MASKVSRHSRAERLIKRWSSAWRSSSLDMTPRIGTVWLGVVYPWKFQMKSEDEDGEEEEWLPGLEPIELPVTDVLDLHSFRPAEVPDLVREYLDAAYGKGLRELRIIHGKGIGVQRQTVRTLLSRDARVEAFGDAPLEAGSWGATWVRMRDE